MNKLKKIALMLVAIAGINLATAQNKTVISFSQLPAKAQTFIKTHFSEANISHIIEESEYFSQKEYNVYLNDGTELEFFANGDWEEVKTRGGVVPAKVIPTAISQYVSKNFANASISEIKKSRRGYEVELSNGLDLDFDKNGKFLRIDD